MDMTTFFAEELKAPLKNPRWSWGAVGQQRVYLRAWADEVQEVNGVRAVALLRMRGNTNRLGYLERVGHLIAGSRAGVKLFVILCKRKRAGVSEIESFDPTVIPVKELVRVNSVVWGTI